MSCPEGHKDHCSLCFHRWAEALAKACAELVERLPRCESGPSWDCKSHALHLLATCGGQVQLCDDHRKDAEEIGKVWRLPYADALERVKRLL